jgi:hypothetical protein
MTPLTVSAFSKMRGLMLYDTQRCYHSVRNWTGVTLDFWVVTTGICLRAWAAFGDALLEEADYDTFIE